MIKIISFDVGGTLIKEPTEKNLTLYDLAKLLKIDYSNVRKVYKEVYQKQTGTFEELLNMFTKKLNIEKEKELIDFFKKKFYLTNSKISNDDLNIIKKLKEDGYKIILFSNSCCLLNNIDKKYDIYFDEKFFSYELGYTKNENESYRIIEKKMKAKPDEFLHIGDNLKSDYSMPTKNGWHALHFGKKTEENSIGDLNEIFEYLGQKNKSRR